MEIRCTKESSFQYFSWKGKLVCGDRMLIPPSVLRDRLGWSQKNLIKPYGIIRTTFLLYLNKQLITKLLQKLEICVLSGLIKNAREL
jgi:hypothetical protein